MLTPEEIYTSSIFNITLSKTKSYAQLLKLRLSFSVVVSALFSYIFFVEKINWLQLFLLLIGGFLITGSSIALNQILEREPDLLMDRTKKRPLPSNQITVRESLIFAFIIGIIGLFLLFYINILSGLLGLLAIVLYVLVYTPMKKITYYSVFFGAISGAIPSMLGCVAVNGEFGIVQGFFFALQFLWQFPHFWAIAWVLDADYKKAGFKLLPSSKGKGKVVALQMIIYTIVLVSLSLVPWILSWTGIISLILIFISGMFFVYKTVVLYIKNDDSNAKKIMYYSFIYLPFVQILYIIDKI